MKNRLHVCLLLAVLAFLSIGCHPEQRTGAQRNTAPITTTTPIQVSTPLPSPTPKPQASPAPAELPKNTVQAPPSHEEIEARVTRTKAFVTEWVKDAQSVATKSGDVDAAYAAAVLDERCYGVLAEPNQEPTVLYYNPPEEKRGCLRFATFTNPERRTNPIWSEVIPRDMPVAYIHMYVTMVFNEEMAGQFSNPDLRGLILLKQMMHWHQIVTYGNNPATQWFGMQLAAYDYEFKVMDRLRLPGYDEFLTAETSKDQPWDRTPYIDDLRIKQMFGKPLSRADYQMLARLLHFRVMFKKFEANPKTEVANKIKFMAPLL